MLYWGFLSLLVTSFHLKKQHEEDLFCLTVQRYHWIHPDPWQSEQEVAAHIAAEGRQLRPQLEANASSRPLRPLLAKSSVPKASVTLPVPASRTGS